MKRLTLIAVAMTLTCVCFGKKTLDLGMFPALFFIAILAILTLTFKKDKNFP